MPLTEWKSENITNKLTDDVGRAFDPLTFKYIANIISYEEPFPILKTALTCIETNGIL